MSGRIARTLEPNPVLSNDYRDGYARRSGAIRGSMGYPPDTTPIAVLSEYLTKAELAAQLHKTVRTIDRMNLAGDGPPPTRIGRTTLYRRAAVLDWLRSREVTRAGRAHKRGGAQ